MTRSGAHWLALAAEVLWWWGAALGIWVLSLSAVSGEELLVATPTSLCCGLLAVVGRRAMQTSWRPRLDDLRPLPLLPAAIVVDAGKVALAALRRRPGAFRQLDLLRARGDGARPAARRALAAFFVSLSPGSYLVDIDPEDGRALVHELPGGGPGPTEVVAR